MRGPISHLHKKPMKMPKQSERCLGSEARKRREGGGSRQDRRGAPINLSRCPALYHSGEYFSSTSSHSLAPHLSLTHSLVPHHPEGLLSSTIGSVVNKKRTHQSGPETSGGERSKSGSNLIGKEAD